MNKHVRELAAQAGFVFWDKEEWGPGPGHIDWSSSYDKELETLVKLVVQDCADTIENMKFSPEGPSSEVKYQRVLAANAILEKYGIIGPAPIKGVY